VGGRPGRGATESDRSRAATDLPRHLRRLGRLDRDPRLRGPLEQAASQDTDQARADNRAHWIAWARAAADELDPTALADVDFDLELGPDDLRLYLGDWSPHEPRKEYRYEKDNDRLAELRQQSTGWHLGMRGRPAWWRMR
jgi:hypothetical protein